MKTQLKLYAKCKTTFHFLLFNGKGEILHWKKKMFSFIYKIFHDPLYDWKKRTPKRKWIVLYDFVKFLTSTLQIRVLDGCNNGPFAYVPLATGFTYYGLLIYTIFYCIYTRSVSQCLPAFCMFGALNSVKKKLTNQNNSSYGWLFFLSFLYFSPFLKAYTIYFTTINKKRFMWKELLSLAGTHIYRDDNRATAYNYICSESLDQSMKTYLTIVIIVIASFTGAVCGPYYQFMTNGMRSTLYNLRLPFFEDNPNTEFLINMCWETFTSFIGAIGLFNMEASFTIVSDTITVSSKLCALELNELSKYMEMEQKNTIYGRWKLRLILRKTKFIDGWVDETMYEPKLIFRKKLIKIWQFFLDKSFSLRK